MRRAQSRAALLALGAALLCAQNRQPAANKPAIPRTAEGKPDLSGVYQSNHTRRGTWEEANPEPGHDAGAKPLDQSVVTEPAPYRPEFVQKVLESYKRRAIDDPTAYCQPPGVPRIHAVALFPLEIVQTPQKIVILYEWFHVFRIIPLNAKHRDDVAPSYMGDSIGHWEGDTLVTDVTDFNNKTWLIGAGTIHSEALHVVERFTRLDNDTIDYDATMEDPNVFRRPWRYHVKMMRREGTRISEYECDEHNVDPERYDQLLKDETLFRRK
jgi:hypothetical protein